MRLDYNLDVENLDEYFLKEMSKLTTSKRELLPFELLSKIFRSKGELSAKKVSLFEKIYALQKAANKRTIIVIEDTESGIGIEDFLKFKKEFKKREATITQSEELISKSTIVLGSENLINHLYHLNNVSTSLAYKYALRLKNVRPTSRFRYIQECIFFANLLIRYEASKKRIAKEKALTVAQFFVLLFLYDGTEKKSAAAYNGAFTNTFNAGRSQIIIALKKLREMGYVQVFGSYQTRTYKITPTGKDLINEIIFKYIAV